MFINKLNMGKTSFSRFVSFLQNFVLYLVGLFHHNFYSMI